MILEKTGQWLKNTFWDTINGETRALVLNPPDDGLCGPVTLAVLAEMLGKLSLFTAVARYFIQIKSVVD